MRTFWCYEKYGTTEGGEQMEQSGKFDALSDADSMSHSSFDLEAPAEESELSGSRHEERQLKKALQKRYGSQIRAKLDMLRTSNH